ncbi:hypothetical protein SARC_05110 [Sphaeroforma arctica JP610]|uniref:Uncharacterized protein n=1 Tax=Sphaeroforma arctica JP610 TaxID=667725 RepID=A0A0L0G370_9EUKA|nr:hypothetical protein SARC_05110 [Sphaeroforma arctica JP610]KNC82613.1 hypothetical protein SARC_05110 [Sphaeroforma arctica JP610]|eukprot:XP_014156515.1 hypothetical protein SARC_05110 [Sphaeroforma arctica JP610]
MQPSANAQNNGTSRRQSMAKTLMHNRFVKLVADKMFSPPNTPGEDVIVTRQGRSDTILVNVGENNKNLKFALPGLLSNKSLESLTRDIVGADIDCDSEHFELTSAVRASGMKDAHPLCASDNSDVFTFDPTACDKQNISHYAWAPHMAPTYNQNKVRVRESEPTNINSNNHTVQRTNSNNNTYASIRVREDCNRDTDTSNRRHSMMLAMASNKPTSDNNMLPSSDSISKSAGAISPKCITPKSRLNTLQKNYNTAQSCTGPATHAGLSARTDPVPAPRRTVSHSITNTRKNSTNGMSPTMAATAPPIRAVTEKQNKNAGKAKIVKIVKVKNAEYQAPLEEYSTETPEGTGGIVGKFFEVGDASILGCEFPPSTTCGGGSESTIRHSAIRAPTSSRRSTLQHSYSVEPRRAPKALPRPDVTAKRYTYFNFESTRDSPSETDVESIVTPKAPPSLKQTATVLEVCEPSSGDMSLPSATPPRKAAPRVRHLNSDRSSNSSDNDLFRSTRAVVTVRTLMGSQTGPKSHQSTVSLKTSSQVLMDPNLQDATLGGPKPVAVLKRAMSTRSTRSNPGAQ